MTFSLSGLLCALKCGVSMDMASYARNGGNRSGAIAPPQSPRNRLLPETRLPVRIISPGYSRHGICLDNLP
jgi:hypothetical protein